MSQPVGGGDRVRFRKSSEVLFCHMGNSSMTGKRKGSREMLKYMTISIKKCLLVRKSL